MTRETIDKMLREGEGYTVEFKGCVNALSDSLFETVCSFSNRYGGHILLGIKEENGKGVVCGVNPAAVEQMKKNFVNTLNNPQVMSPSLYLTLEEFDYDGKVVLWTYVPVTSQLQFCCKRIFDRNHEADQDVSTSSDLVSNISNRKSSNYLERKIFPYAAEDDLCMDMIPRIRQLAINRYPRHVWKELNDRDLFKSAGLYEKNFVTGEEGFNMAAILLFGKKETIRSCVPGYRTDAICRIRDVERYDDRLIVEENLIRSYDLLIEFIEKHTNDKFCLEKDQCVSARTIIAREMVSNILVHRDFSSACPARVIIERGRLSTENRNRSQRFGRIDLANFTPYAKNPIIANFFVNIGYADSLGSGVRKLYKYSQLYTGTDPVIEESDMFRTSVHISDETDTAQNAAGTEQSAEQKAIDTEQMAINTEQSTKFDLSERQNIVLDYLARNPNASLCQIGENLGISKSAARDIVYALVQKGFVVHIGSRKFGHWKTSKVFGPDEQIDEGKL